VQALEAAADVSDVKPAVVQALRIHLYKFGNSLLRTRAMLSHIYHHALVRNNFHTARDMLLMSHLQESIHSADVATQILYNRTVVQLGLCTFLVSGMRSYLLLWISQVASLSSTELSFRDPNN
jgi:translation initiation factor 3 subunit C